MKKTLRSAMLSTICMLVVAVMSLTGVTYAWFSASTTANIQGMTVNVSAADGGFQLSADNGTTWKSNLTLTDTSAQLNPVSTADAESFFTAVVDPDDAKMITTTADAPVEGAATANVFYKKILAKNTGEKALIISLSNLLTAADGKTANPVFVNTTANKNSAAAARVAVIVDNTLAYIFGDENVYGVTKAARFDSTAGATDTTNMKSQGTKTAPSECTFELAGQVAGQAEKISTIEILVWIEGQDAQCINENAASTFTVELDFSAAQKN